MKVVVVAVAAVVVAAPLPASRVSHVNRALLGRRVLHVLPRACRALHPVQRPVHVPRRDPLAGVA